MLRHEADADEQYDGDQEPEQCMIHADRQERVGEDEECGAEHADEYAHLRDPFPEHHGKEREYDDGRRQAQCPLVCRCDVLDRIGEQARKARDDQDGHAREEQHAPAAGIPIDEVPVEVDRQVARPLQDERCGTGHERSEQAKEDESADRTCQQEVGHI